ncbi:sulfotransferase [Falsihalocynthiibacter sp. S25ZX9]|uniref:sulfotransferase n=1 Tax=Falsihalocynthiibacter sp. S25ZX9 TaxID=3240870 RepID=UPI00350ED5CF
MAQEATLLYGVGATKSGTTWLHDYLVSHPQAVTPPRKELHYFDSLSGEVAFSLEGMQATIGSEIQSLQDRLSKAPADNKRPILRRIGRLEDLRAIYVQGGPEGLEVYRRYFASEIARTGAKVATDITPSYGMLSDTWFARLVTAMPVTRFVYVMRDPVDRLWSNIRMNSNNKAKEGESVAELCMNTVDRLLVKGRHGTLERSNYAATLDKLERHVPESNRLVMFFENMFSQNMMDIFCKFLGISEHPAKVGRPSYVGIALRLDDARRRGLAELLAPQYAAVEARFGALPDRWQQNMTKV